MPGVPFGTPGIFSPAAFKKVSRSDGPNGDTICPQGKWRRNFLFALTGGATPESKVHWGERFQEGFPSASTASAAESIQSPSNSSTTPLSQTDASAGSSGSLASTGSP